MANINIRVDDVLKDAFQEVCSELGMDMSSAITVFIKKATREKRIPFEVSVNPSYKKENSEAETLELTDDEKIDVVAARILRRFRPAFEELAR